MYKGFYIQAFLWNAYYHLHLGKNRESDCCWCHKVVMIPDSRAVIKGGDQGFPLVTVSMISSYMSFHSFGNKSKKEMSYSCTITQQIDNKYPATWNVTDSPAWKGYVTRIIYCFRSILCWHHNNSPFNHTQNAPVELWRRLLNKFLQEALTIIIFLIFFAGIHCSIKTWKRWLKFF